MKLVALILMLALAAQASADLKQEAAAILRANCFKCHGTKRDDWDASSLASAREIGDTIIEKITADKMPPGKLPKLTATEKKTLADWLAQKPIPAPEEKPLPPPVSEGTLKNLNDPRVKKAIAEVHKKIEAKQPPYQRKFLNDTWVVQRIREDTGKRGDSLYISLANLFNQGQTKQQILDAEGAISKAANLLSTGRQIVVPEKVDKNGLVLRVDVFKLGWSDDEAAQLFKAYPYAELRNGFIRGDWFVSRALAAPLYYTLLGIPATQAELDASLGIDRQRFINNNLVKRSALTTSKVAFHNRAIEWSPANTGASRLTYDTKNEENNRNITTNPLGPIDRDNPFASRAFAHDAAEYIADLPNGLHLYAAFNGNGNRQNTVPENVASDPNQYSGTTSIVPGISCACCHKKGIQIPGADVVRDGAPLFNVSELAKVQSLYPTKEQFAALLKGDEGRYLAAEKKAVSPFTAVEEPLSDIALEYNKPLDLKRAAQESNTTEGTLKAAILADATLQSLGLRPLVDGKTISRNTFESLASGISPAQRVAQLLGR